MHNTLPPPGADAAAASAALERIIASEIIACDGWMSFARYMELTMYAPGLGYYSGGAHKFGSAESGGDFVTAPEITPLFGQTLARQVAQVMAASSPQVIEAGAGSGRLAADLLLTLTELNSLPERYEILELSGELRARQQATLRAEVPQLFDRVIWLDELPEHFSGCLVGNEVLDAMPTHQVHWADGEVFEGGVSLLDGRLTAAERAAPPALKAAAAATPVSAHFRSEISLASRVWISELSRRLQRGALILIDYGMPAHQLYHPGREGGSIRCHYRHRVHDDPFWFPGLSDITSHVDFTAVAEAAYAAGLAVAGYTTQAMFLMNCGIGEVLAKVGAEGTAAEAYRAQVSAQRLISPTEMGELFKVIALTRGIDVPLLGFKNGDRTHAL